MLNGIAIALAWPDTYCKKAGAWYDTPAEWLKISNGNYYKVGHAALVLIEKTTGLCHYFDFGRYHSPHLHGRVRSAHTDHDLELNIRALFDDTGKLSNYEDILWELYNNESCHGTGKLHASYIDINFEKAFNKAREMQTASPTVYGPFVPGGTNCSRFVNTVIVAGSPKWYYRMRLKYPTTISPTPKGNVKTLKHYSVVGEDGVLIAHHGAPRKGGLLPKVVPAPTKPQNLPENLHWLSGEGCGSWFYLNQEMDGIDIQRFSSDGKLECRGIFHQVSGPPFNIHEPFEVTYPSHCAEVHLIQNEFNVVLRILSKKG